jgi:hypothetical protein
MRLSADLISRFQRKYLESFGEHITPDVAEAELLDLAALVLIVQSAKTIEIEGGRDD